MVATQILPIERQLLPGGLEDVTRAPGYVVAGDCGFDEDGFGHFDGGVILAGGVLGVQVDDF